jgi:hypothetical protein
LKITLIIKNNKFNKEVIRFNRPLRSAACCWCACKNCDRCSHIIIVEAGEEILGYVGQRYIEI